MSQPPAAQVTGAQSLVRSLEAAGVDTVFGIPGGAILPLYDPLMDSTAIRHILVRHEQGAGHAAEGYAQATGRVGVCMATSGPGATNLVTPIADAYMDSVPIVAITGQVPSAAIGTDAFQEADICGITMPDHQAQLPGARGRGHPARSSRRRSTSRAPAARARCWSTSPRTSCRRRRVHWPTGIDLPATGRSASRTPSRSGGGRLIVEARKPVFYVGGGVLKARAAAELRVLAELTGIPVVTTLMARGAFPDSHPQHLGMPGMHGTVAPSPRCRSPTCSSAWAPASTTGSPASWTLRPGAAVIHADIDPAEIGKNRTADVPIVGDCRETIADLVVAVRELYDAAPAPT
jgi:acetolactate synthase-1/2/3 large subunit